MATAPKDINNLFKGIASLSQKKINKQRTVYGKKKRIGKWISKKISPK